MKDARVLMLLVLFLTGCGPNPFGIPPNRVLDVGDTRIILCSVQLPNTWEYGYDIIKVDNRADILKRVTMFSVDEENRQSGEAYLNKSYLERRGLITREGIWIPEHTRLFVSVECADGIADWRPCVNGNGFYGVGEDVVGLETLPLDEEYQIGVPVDIESLSILPDADQWCPRRRRP